PRRRAGLAVAAAAAALLLIAGGLAWGTMRPASDQTHLARLVEGLHGDAAGLGPTGLAELSVDARVPPRPWGLLMLLEAAGMWAIAAMLRRGAGTASGTASHLRAAAQAFTVAALAAWLFNDSGAPAAALLLASGPPTLLLTGELGRNTAMASVAQARVEPVAQAVAQEVERRDRAGERERRPQRL